MNFNRSIIISCLVASLASVMIPPSVLATPLSSRNNQFRKVTSTITSPEELIKIVSDMEKTWEDQYRNHLNRDFSTTVVTPSKVEQSLQNAESLTNTKPAFIWINAYPDYIAITISTAKNTQYYALNVTRSEVLQEVTQLIKALQNPYLSPESEYLPPAQKLYQWFIQPIRPALKIGNIDSLIFCLGKGLRTLPLAALHDGEQFLIEEYAVSRLPAFSLTDLTVSSLQNSSVLAMGASEFQDLTSLPAVPIELTTITQDIWRGETFLNQEFTLDNLLNKVETDSFPIVHLATHAKIEPGELNNSYIQLWEEQLNLDQFPNLQKYPGWSEVGLLVLSACETAVIDEQNNSINEGVEMSFAGLALQAGVKSVIASSWDISDQGTLGLMAQFYQEYKTSPTKMIALQKAQLALLNEKVHIQGQTLSNVRSSVPIPINLFFNRQQNFSHPYYWATFTVIGNPW